MEKLNFPDFDEDSPPPSVLSMNDFAKFVEGGLRHVVSRELFYLQQRDRVPIDIPFKLK